MGEAAEGQEPGRAQTEQKSQFGANQGGFWEAVPNGAGIATVHLYRSLGTAMFNPPQAEGRGTNPPRSVKSKPVRDGAMGYLAGVFLFLTPWVISLVGTL